MRDLTESEKTTAAWLAGEIYNAMDGLPTADDGGVMITCANGKTIYVDANDMDNVNTLKELWEEE
jgi:hypothetical protein|nr:MAG TPA: hypothetical protein [Caudoviricetes sp.]